MTLELWNTFATFGTFVVIAATAIAALVQLRHLRAGNQINAILTISENAIGQRFRDALHLCDRALLPALEDPLFRRYSAALSRDQTPPDVGPELVEVRRAAILVGNTLEQLGIMVKNNIVERSVFLDAYCAVVVGAWNRLEFFNALGRESTGFANWENFEYLTVLAQDWLKENPEGTYPKGARRLKLRNPWPVSPTPTTA